MTRISRRETTKAHPGSWHRFAAGKGQQRPQHLGGHGDDLRLDQLQGALDGDLDGRFVPIARGRIGLDAKLQLGRIAGIGTVGDDLIAQGAFVLGHPAKMHLVGMGEGGQQDQPIPFEAQEIQGVVFGVDVTYIVPRMIVPTMPPPKSPFARQWRRQRPNPEPWANGQNRKYREKNYRSLGRKRY